jgi:NAD+ synthase (glutamine-hydrolysing)
MRLVQVGLAAVNTTVGAFAANTERALTAARQMAAAQVTVALFPEQLIGGYPQEDLVQWQAFVDRQWSELLRFARETTALPLVSCLGVGIAHRGFGTTAPPSSPGARCWGWCPKRSCPPMASSTRGAPSLAASPA